MRAVRRWAVLAALVASCGGGGGGAGPSNDLLIVGYDREPDTMNRFSTHILEDIQTCIVEGLTVTDEKMQVLPLLAREVPSLANGGVVLRPDGGMDVIWKLRPGVQWHDGKPFTSADVKFTVDAINGPNWNPESTDGFDRISSVDTPDSLTAVVHYKEHYAAYALQFVRGALPRHVLEGKDIERATEYNRNPLGTGPYHLAEWKTGEYVLLERVPHYWRGDSLPKIKRIMFRFVPNTTTRVNQLLAGEVHVVALLPWDRARDLAQAKGTVVAKTMGNAYEHVTLNEKAVPAFKDVRVRRALLVGIDREAITKQILDGLAPVSHGPVQPVSWAYTDSIKHWPFDVARAKAMLDSAGWKAGADGMRAKDGAPLRFTLMTQAGFVVRENVAQVLQRQWHDLGADVKIELVDGTAISTKWFSGEFDAMLHWWQMPADPDLLLFFAADRTPPAGRNINYYVDQELSRMLVAADREVDQAKRRALLIPAQQRIADQVPELWLYNVTRLDAVPTSLKGFKGNPTNTGIFWNVAEWEIKP
jgi:peptide/nickel transport system substrate-binding protein